MPFAHSRNQLGQRQDLVAHLRAVAALCEGFAAQFDAAEIGHFLGLWHDVGKFSPEFQSYLLASEGGSARRGRGIDHKAAGVELAAAQHLGLIGLVLAGHHGGLKSPMEFRTWFAERTHEKSLPVALDQARRTLPDLEPLKPIALPQRALMEPISAELLIRMLFSALVDADYLDTESHFSPEKAGRRGVKVSIEELWKRFEADQRRFGGKATTDLGLARDEIFQMCLQAAELPPGIFRLTVPTGGGKTRSAMAFALRHALRHGQRKVMVAVPFITITEQTADVYRDIFGDDDDGDPIVLEHHSGARWRQTGDDEAETSRLDLAAENWDAPIIVTTTVQLFESLFDNSPSRCRRVHALAGSVIILDEAQSLPPHLLGPVLSALEGLTSQFGATVVLSTATQPAFESIPAFTSVKSNEIVRDPQRFFSRLKRVSYEWRTDKALGWQEIAGLLRDERQVLAVVNTKKDAMALMDALDDPEALHLSTMLCGAHRRGVVREVRKRLADGDPCRLISTQVIEAGVDVDFPVVVRALGPLDSVIQAAGRCNREGQREAGRVIVVNPADGGMPRGAYRTGAQVTRALLGSGAMDPDDPAITNKYFRRLFETLGELGTDREGIQQLRESFEYPEVGKRFRMIDDDTESVAVPFGSEAERSEVASLMDRLRDGASDHRLIYRRLQPYLVSLRKREAERYRSQGLIVPVSETLGEWFGKYHPVRGLTGDGPDPDVLVV